MCKATSPPVGLFLDLASWRRPWLQGYLVLGLRDPANLQVRLLGARDRRVGHWTKHQETLEPRRTPGLRSQRTRLLRPQARSFSFGPGRVGFPRRSDLGTTTGSRANVFFHGIGTPLRG